VTPSRRVLWKFGRVDICSLRSDLAIFDVSQRSQPTSLSLGVSCGVNYCTRWIVELSGTVATYVEELAAPGVDRRAHRR
jgi:short subunit dehydrogenase-like uncharacterized protein